MHLDALFVYPVIVTQRDMRVQAAWRGGWQTAPRDELCKGFCCLPVKLPDSTDVLDDGLSLLAQLRGIVPVQKVTTKLPELIGKVHLVCVGVQKP